MTEEEEMTEMICVLHFVYNCSAVGKDVFFLHITPIRVS
jgi:hypothetical protein